LSKKHRAAVLWVISTAACGFVQYRPPLAEWTGCLGAVSKPGGAAGGADAACPGSCQSAPASGAVSPDHSDGRPACIRFGNALPAVKRPGRAPEHQPP